MTETFWFVIVGTLLIAMALADSSLRRLPITTAILYLLIGFSLGPTGIGFIQIDPLSERVLLERMTEIIVIISLFSAGLKLRTPLSSRRWAVPVRLAFGSMTLTVGMITLVGWVALDLPIGAAVLLGAILAPTDPVLATDVQVRRPTDQDRLRFGLTGEAGMNDGAAFPFVMLGMGLLGLHELGSYWWRWLAVDVLWAVAGGLAVGALFGTLIGRLVVYLRRRHREAVGVDDFLALGLIALSYGIALTIGTYGFLAVFAAGLSLRRIERRSTEGASPPVAVEATGEDEEEVATGAETAPAYMADAVLGFSDQLERIGTFAVVLLLGGMIPDWLFSPEVLTLIAVFFLVVRPIAVTIGLVGSWTTAMQRGLIGWFGIRGVGSVYYLMYAANRGLPAELANRLAIVTFATVAVSILVHGLSTRPLMGLYSQRHRRDRAPAGSMTGASE
ncbi:MAG TPA: sodium:proton antiporter [Longimicrobiaceae bacterium]|nr:sodium:proton antiporter [Longimicrobiaceae bacterium]